MSDEVGVGRREKPEPLLKNRTICAKIPIAPKNTEIVFEYSIRVWHVPQQKFVHVSNLTVQRTGCYLTFYTFDICGPLDRYITERLTLYIIPSQPLLLLCRTCAQGLWIW